MSSHYLIRTFFLILGCISLSFTSCKKEAKTIKHSDVIFKKEGELVIFKKTSDSTKIDLDIEIADNDYEIQTGLMYRTSMKSNQGMLFIFDDIHYSPAMEQAWQQIKSSDKCGVSIDLFFLGFVFCRPVLQKQHFVLRF